MCVQRDRRLLVHNSYWEVFFTHTHSQNTRNSSHIHRLYGAMNVWWVCTINTTSPSYAAHTTSSSSSRIGLCIITYIYTRFVVPLCRHIIKIFAATLSSTAYHPWWWRGDGAQRRCGSGMRCHGSLCAKSASRIINGDGARYVSFLGRRWMDSNV